MMMSKTDLIPPSKALNRLSNGRAASKSKKSKDEDDEDDDGSNAPAKPAKPKGKPAAIDLADDDLEDLIGDLEL